MGTRIVAAVALAISAQSGIQPFAGTWTATFQGQTQIRLELREVAGTLTGQISLGTVHVDKDGVVDVLIEPATDSTPIVDVTLRDRVLSFSRKDGNETDRFELRLVGDAAELRFLITSEFAAALARDGMGVPKPVRLTPSSR